jgi:hypothetical protein
MSMTTAADLIRGALKQIRVIGQGETLTAEEMTDSLDLLNMMLESWSLDRLYVYHEKQESVPLVPGKNAYTWGSGGDIASGRPVDLTSVYTLSAAGVSYAAHILMTAQEYDQITVKDVQSPWPTHVFLDTSYPLATLRVWPTPSVAWSLVVRSYQQLQQFANLTDVISLPPGYRQAIIFNLAANLAGAFGVEIPASVANIAATAAGRVKRLNVPIGKAIMEPTMLSSARRTFNIMVGN